jgi:hypothetical protein
MMNRLRGMLSRLRDWAIGPGGWLADSNLDEQLSAVDVELDELEKQRKPLGRNDYGYHYETKPYN